MKIRKKLSFIILSSCLAIGIWGCGNGGHPPIYDNKTELSEGASEADTAGQEEIAPSTSGLYEIIEWNTTNSTIKLYDINRGRRDDYAYDEFTDFMDKYGNRTGISQMLPGRIVSMEQTRQTGPIKTLQISDTAWEYDDIKRFSIDEERNMIIIADTKYYYEDDLNVFSDAEKANLSDIGKKDILRIQGIDRKIYSVSIISGHGIIKLKNTELFEDGWMSLGSKIYMKVTKDMEIEVQEGTYLFTVANDGYGDSREVTINRGEELVIDLDELKGEGPKYCTMTFELGIEDALVQIDGEYVDISEPIEVKYGIHKLVIDAEGYETWSKRLYVNSEEATIEIRLTSESTSSSTESSAETETEAPKKSSESKNSESKSSENKSSESKSSEGTESAKDSYLKTLSDIIDTLTGGKSD